MTEITADWVAAMTPPERESLDLADKLMELEEQLNELQEWYELLRQQVQDPYY
jgi:hypothetical protein